MFFSPNDIYKFRLCSIVYGISKSITKFNINTFFDLISNIVVCVFVF